MRPIRASLKDLLPTVADWVGFPVPDGVTGMSLAGELDMPTRASWDRPLALETGFTLPSLLDSDLDERRLMDEGAVYYDLQPDGRLTLREDRLAELMGDKQRAVLFGSWLLAMVPGAVGQAASRLVLANVDTLEYIELDDGDLSGWPTNELLGHLCRRFRREEGLKTLDPPEARWSPMGTEQGC